MDMWTTASEDAEAEQMARRVAAARVSVTDVWPFLAAASSEADYANRKAMVVDRLDSAVSKMLPSDPVAFSVVRASLETSLDDDYRLLAEARQVEAVDVQPGDKVRSTVSDDELGTSGGENFQGADLIVSDVDSDGTVWAYNPSNPHGNENALNPGQYTKVAWTDSESGAATWWCPNCLYEFSNNAPAGYAPTCPKCGTIGASNVDPAAGMTDLASRRKVEAADSSKTCAVCGAAIERDPEGEDNRGWHHADGSKHQHEAMPFVSDDAKNSSPSKQGYPKSSALSTEAANSTCRHCGLKINRDATGMWVDHNGHDACKVNGKGFGKGHQPNANGRWGSTESSLSVEAETTAQPGEVKHLDNGAYQRSTCKNCGGQIRRQNSFSSGWQHSKNNSKYCPDETKESVLRWADAGIKAADLKSKVADFTDQTAYDWGYEKGSEARDGNPDKHLTTDSDTWSNEGGLGGPINWQTSDEAFPRGFRDGLAGNPKQSSLQTDAGYDPHGACPGTGNIAGGKDTDKSEVACAYCGSTVPVQKDEQGFPRLVQHKGKSASLQTEAGTDPAAANDATPDQGSEPSQGTVQRRVDQDPDTGEFVGSEWAPKEGDPNTLVQTDATFNKNPRFKTQDAANAWSAEVDSTDDSTDDDADANADAPADDDAKDTTKPDPANSKMPAQFEKKKQSSVSGSRDPFVSSPVVVVGGGGGAFYGATGGTQATITVTADTAPPYYIEEQGGKYVVVNDEGKVKGTFDTKDEARAQQSALYANVPGAAEKAKEDHGDPKPKVQSAKTARATQVVYQGTSADQVNDAGGPTVADLEPLIGKNLTIVFYNESGVAADYESGRITAVHPLPHDEVEFDWDRGEGYAQPTNGLDVYQIMRVEEPTDPSQMSLFSSKTAFQETPISSTAELKKGDKVWFTRGWMRTSVDGVVASVGDGQVNIKGVPAHGVIAISDAELASGNWILRRRALMAQADGNPYTDANPYMGDPGANVPEATPDLPTTTRPAQTPVAAPPPVDPTPPPVNLSDGNDGLPQGMDDMTASLIPVICRTDGQRFFVAASGLTEVLRCVCGSDDLDLDDPAYCADCFEQRYGYEPDMGDDSSTFADGTCANCGKEGIVFTPDEGMDRYLNKDSAKTADVVSDPAANLLGDVDAVTEKVTCSTCFTDHTVTAVDPAQPMPACPNCGAKTLSPAGSTLASRKRAKVAEIMRGIRETNPGMESREAMRVAKQTIRRFPQMIGN